MSLRVETHASCLALEPAWQQLWTARPENPFLHPGWSLAFESAMSPHIQPVLVSIWEKDDLLALLPLRLDADAVLRPLSAPRADYDDALIAPGREETACGLLADWLMSRRFDLADMPHDSPLAARLHQRGARRILSSECPGLVMTAASVAALAKRESVRRHSRSLQKLGPVQLRAVPGSERETRLRHLMDQHLARWLATGGSSLFLDQRNVAFYQELLRRPDFDAFARFDALFVGEQAVAYHLGLATRSCFIWYKPAFDLNLARLGPGEVLLEQLVRASLERGLTYFDFTRGGEAFKKRFCSEVRRNQRLSHRLPIVRPFLKRWWSRARRVKSWVGHHYRHARSLLERHDELFFRLLPPSSPPPPPMNGVATFGSPDLVALGMEHRHHPRLANPQRMASAVERLRRGDRLLTLRDPSGALLHCSWVRIDTGHIIADHTRLPIAPAEDVAVIFDCWTAPECRGRGLYPWALRWLAAQMQAEGREAWIYTSATNASSIRGIQKAGVDLTRALPHGANPNTSSAP